jgi:hypothetical protein
MKIFLLFLLFLNFHICHSSEQIDLESFNGISKHEFNDYEVGTSSIGRPNIASEDNKSNAFIQTIGGNAMCSMVYIGGSVLGIASGIFYLYIKVGVQNTNIILGAISTPIMAGVAIGGIMGCVGGCVLKRYIES